MIRGVRKKKNEGLAALGNSSTAHASRLSIFSKLFWQPFKHTLRLELRKNPRTSAAGFSLPTTTEARAALLRVKPDL